MKKNYFKKNISNPTVNVSFSKAPAMGKHSFFGFILLAFVIFLTGCQKDMRTNNGISKGLDAEGKITTRQTSALPPELQKKLDNLKNTSADNLIEKNKFPDFFSYGEGQYRDMALNAVGASTAACNANTNLNIWLDSQLSDWNNDVIYYALQTDILNVPANYTILFENSSASQSFGINGEYTQILTKTFKDLKRFWNINSDNIVLVALHGNMLADKDKLYKTYLYGYGLDEASAAYWTNLVLEMMEYFPQYRDGNHPIFSFNAFASQSFQFPPFGTVPAKISMGDGMLQGFTAIGYGDVAPQAILAHEYGHQVQYQIGMGRINNTPEESRRIELMADAFSAYYLSHARGASMQWKRVKQFLEVFFNIGDCSFTNSSHHGTPTQRMAAAEWAYELANNAQKQGHILTSEEFASLFAKQLPDILAQ